MLQKLAPWFVMLILFLFILGLEHRINVLELDVFNLRALDPNKPVHTLMDICGGYHKTKPDPNCTAF
jgi:hypothetical protein